MQMVEADLQPLVVLQYRSASQLPSAIRIVFFLDWLLYRSKQSNGITHHDWPWCFSYGLSIYGIPATTADYRLYPGRDDGRQPGSRDSKIRGVRVSLGAAHDTGLSDTRTRPACRTFSSRQAEDT